MNGSGGADVEWLETQHDSSYFASIMRRFKSSFLVPNGKDQYFYIIFLPTDEAFKILARKMTTTVDLILKHKSMYDIARLHAGSKKLKITSDGFEKEYDGEKMVSIDGIDIQRSVRVGETVVHYLEGLLLTHSIERSLAESFSRPLEFTDEEHPYNVVPHKDILDKIADKTMKGRVLISLCLSSSKVNKFCNSDDQKLFKDRLWSEFYIRFTRQNYGYPDARSLYIQMYTLYAYQKKGAIYDENLYTEKNGAPPQLPYGKYNLIIPAYTGVLIREFRAPEGFLIK